jgi:predicted nucleic acid-binding protein
MIVVSDASPVNYLVLIDAISVLPALFGEVFIPRAVWSELCSNDSPPMVRGWAVSLGSARVARRR